jgi:DUF971 family protein
VIGPDVAAVEILVDQFDPTLFYVGDARRQGGAAWGSSFWSVPRQHGVMIDPGSTPTPEMNPAGTTGRSNQTERDRVAVENIEVEKAESVTVTFADGEVAVFGLEDLRRACPCAGCRSRRDQGLEAWPEPRSPRPLLITDAALHGAWALTFTWNDGHSAGIYPFTSLRRWYDGEPTYLPDSGLGGSPKGQPDE